MSSRPASARGAWLTVSAVAVLWAVVFHRLHFLWSIDQDYAYGWAVPPLAALLLYLRWRDRPEPGDGRSLSTAVVLGVVAAAFLPLRIVQESTPDWSAVNWAVGLLAVVLTLGLAQITGGSGYRQWFIWPVVFCLTAIPWPQRLEQGVTSMLMRGIAAVAVEFLSWMHIPALRFGHLVRLPSGVLGVDEACSGLRSLQALLMVAVFLGELHRLSAARRFALVLVGLGLAVVGNAVRACSLALVGARSGFGDVAHWHAPAGFAVLLFGLAGVWTASQRWRSRHVGNPSEGSVPRPPAWAAAVSVALLVWFVAVEAAVEAWYRTGAAAPRRQEWAMAMRSSWKEVPIPAAARSLLLCDEARGAAWRDEDGLRWIAYWLRWSPGRTASQSARMHRPESCLQANGAIFLKNRGPVEVEAHGIRLRFDRLTFLRDGASVQVYFCLDDGANTDTYATGLLHDWSGWSRLQRALSRQRNLGQQSLEVALIGEPSPEAADAKFVAVASFLIVRGK